MNKLFLIDGAAGTGKSDLIDFAKTYLDNYDINVISKFTTRSRRIIEEAKQTDLTFISNKEFDERKNNHESYYTYPYGGNWYGFEKKELIQSVTNHEFTFVIIRNKALIDRIQNELKDVVYVIHLFIYSDEGLAAKRLQQEGFDEDAIKFRLQRSEQVWNDYLDTFDDNLVTIINNSNREEYHKKISHLLQRYSKRSEQSDMLYITPNLKFELISPLVGYKEKMQKQLETYPFEKNVFLMMKFREENYAFYQHIKKELNLRHLNCVRADEAIWNITNDIYNPIAVLYCCKYGIALFDKPEENSHYNPNVAYELGMMHCQKKDCLIMRHNSLKEVPFDLLKNLYVNYNSELEFEQILNNWLKALNI